MIPQGEHQLFSTNDDGWSPRFVEIRDREQQAVSCFGDEQLPELAAEFGGYKPAGSGRWKSC